MTISDRIFERLNEINMTQKELSKRTGIAQSTISEWKHKNTTPTSDRIYIISKTLGVTPDYLLSGAISTKNSRNNALKYFLVNAEDSSDIKFLIEAYNKLDEKSKDKVLGYIRALVEQ